MAAPAATQAQERRSLPNGIWGVLLFVCTEGAFFGTLIGTYFYLQFQDRPWPPRGIEAPSAALPLVLTGVLVLTAVPMWLAARSARAGRLGAAIGAVVLATLVQAGYLAVQITSYLSDLDKFSITGSAYGSIYFTLLGAHHAHVAVGLLLNCWLLASISRGLTAYRVKAVRVIAWYWYFVAAAGIAVVAAQVSPS